MLHRAVMVSKARVDLGVGALNGELGSILACCMKASTDRHMTGGLVWDSGWFMEVLEGRRDALEDFWQHIIKDPRHADPQRLEFVPLLKRSYDTWSVATPRRGPANHSLLRNLRSNVPTAGEVRTHVRTIIATGLVAESPPLVCAAGA
ncbi:BLUF domain-containing protein [uncultured Maricaulis sp.]|uniref:BLUF domain-containing protein n=1 Tax=uncultured Maricaulis sp. TaxID=174710 RepID=UPI0030DB7ECC